MIVMKVTWRYGIHPKDNLFSKTSEDFRDEVEDKDMLKVMSDIFDDLKILNEREKKVIIAKFFEYNGNGDEEKTLEDIGKNFGVTRERVRQIKNDAIRKIRRALREKEVFGKTLI